MPGADCIRKAPAEPRPLADRDFALIRELALRTFGLDLREGKQDLVSTRLQRLVRAGGFRSYHEYYRHVLRDSTGESLMELIDALATNHTAFFREPDQFEFLRRHVIPELPRGPSVDIWSAACSTGEEVWTLALLFREALPYAKLRVIGTDISHKALQYAVRAIYSEERVRALPREWQNTGFVKEGHSPNRYRVKPAIRACATFRRLNLLEPFPSPLRFPLIFCRNAMIYFNQPTQQKVIAHLGASLKEGGYLFVGHAESFSGIQHGLEYVRPAVYRKPASERGGPWNGSS
jgi:chemotaxis protein methyltransferase CheR